MNGTLTFTVVDKNEQYECPADDTTWLSRYLLSTPEDTALHRDENGGLRLAGGRWHVFVPHPLPGIRLRLIPHDGSPIDDANRARIEQALTRAADLFRPSLTAPVLERELPNGTWILGIGTDQRWYLLLLVVTGQPETHDHIRMPDASVGAPTRAETRTDPPTQWENSWPPFRVSLEEALRTAREWLAGAGAQNDLNARLRRYALAYVYSQYILGRPGAEDLDRGMVFRRLRLPRKTSLDSWRRDLIDKIWPPSLATPSDLRSFLLTYGLLTPDDVTEAKSYIRGFDRQPPTTPLQEPQE